MKDNNFYTIDDQGTLELLANKEIDEAIEVANLSLTTDDILRLEEDVSKRFSGVRSCSDPGVHNSNANAALNKWAQTKIFEHRNLRYIRFGHLGGTAHWTNRTSWDGRRSCSGYVVIKCYIEFRKL